MRGFAIERRDVVGGGLVGHLCEGHRFVAYTLERLWKNNQPFVSCIPDGNYICRLQFSPRFNCDLYELEGVPGRSEIKFHAANYPAQLQGCIALGLQRPTEETPCRRSRAAVNQFHAELAGAPFRVHVRTHSLSIEKTLPMGLGV